MVLSMGNIYIDYNPHTQGWSNYNVPSFTKLSERAASMDCLTKQSLDKLETAPNESEFVQNKEVAKRALNKASLNGFQVLILKVVRSVKKLFQKDLTELDLILNKNHEVKRRIKMIEFLKFSAKLISPNPAGTEQPVNQRNKAIEEDKNPEDEKGALDFFNHYFPNVVVVGGVETKDGKETLRQLDRLGVKYQTRGPFDGSNLPVEVWSKLSDEIDQMDGKVRLPLAAKIEAGDSLTEEEAKNVSTLKKTAACFFLHRDVIMQTIQAYKKASGELELLKKEPRSEINTKKTEELAKKVTHYSSLFVFEHNGRFGYVQKDGSVALPASIRDHVLTVFKELPQDWEWMTLFSRDNFSGSVKIPQDINSEGKFSLIHPGVGMTTKGYAISSRFYDDLEGLFNRIKPESASEIFYPIDANIYRLSREAEAKGRRFQLAPLRTMMYRAAGASFHTDSNDPNSYSSRNLAGTNYKYTALTAIPD